MLQALEILCWIAAVLVFIWLPVATYHSYLYWQYCKHSFLSARCPYVTILLMISSIYIVLHRMIEALIAFDYLPDLWELTTPHTWTQFIAFDTLLLYKLCLC